MRGPGGDREGTGRGGGSYYIFACESVEPEHRSEYNSSKPEPSISSFQGENNAGSEYVWKITILLIINICKSSTLQSQRSHYFFFGTVSMEIALCCLLPRDLH